MKVKIQINAASIFNDLIHMGCLVNDQGMYVRYDVLRRNILELDKLPVREELESLRYGLIEYLKERGIYVYKFYAALKKMDIKYLDENFCAEDEKAYLARLRRLKKKYFPEQGWNEVRTYEYEYDYRIEKNKLILINQKPEKIIPLGFEIAKVKKVKNVYIIKLYIPRSNKNHKRHIFGINEAGEKIWKIPELEDCKESNFYKDIIFENGELIITSIWGKDYVYDVDTGQRIKEAVF
ncbi:MAG: hypothetical protein HY761_09710 [Candidatus Omnitrophica bacterium]|nr:hypothetical protein [Candidatus Omnitrophota bacterium]